MLGGSGVVTSGVIRLLIWFISIVTLLLTLLIITHEPPSGFLQENITFRVGASRSSSYRGLHNQNRV